MSFHDMKGQIRVIAEIMISFQEGTLLFIFPLNKCDVLPVVNQKQKYHHCFYR